MNQTAPIVIDAPTELTAANCQTFREHARAAIGANHISAHINLSATRFIDSSGLGVLVSIHKTLRERGGDLCLLALTPPVMQILELTRMHRVFEIIAAP